MGIEAMVIGAIASTAVQGISSMEAADARAEALRKRQQQEEVAADQKSLERTSQLSKVIGSQEAAAGVRGIDVVSPSFKAIQADSFNEWAADERASQLSLGYSKEATDEAVTNEEWSGVAGVLGAGANIFSLATGGSGGIGKGSQTTYTPRDIPRYKGGL